MANMDCLRCKKLQQIKIQVWFEQLMVKQCFLLVNMSVTVKRVDLLDNKKQVEY